MLPVLEHRFLSWKVGAGAVPVLKHRCLYGACPRTSVPVLKHRCPYGACPKTSVPLWCLSQKIGARVVPVLMISTGHDRRPRVGAGLVTYVPSRCL